ncbi:MAG: glycoside hydrolase family 15 protein [Solirubrobacterales bacterium]|nr:glycoside hydrolase family 15 protein [Solirubrobacterales bacterium]
MESSDRYPAIGDYGLIGDCHSAALVSRSGAIDWCCFPRFDGGSAFGRLLDWEEGGYCAISPPDADRGEWSYTREYLEDALVLVTTFHGPAGEVRVTDCFLITEDTGRGGERHMLRVIEGQRGSVELELRIAPRFDYGNVRPWIRRHGHRLHSAIGGNDALIVWCEHELVEDPDHELVGRLAVDAGDRVTVSLRYCSPELVDADGPTDLDARELGEALERTVSWWREWAQTVRMDGRDEPAVRRSALALKALTYAPTGAIAAAATTSLPEVVGGPRNYDYRYAWVRDSSFSSRALAELGCEHEADAFRAFIMRSAAGHADDLQVLYGVGGERRITVEELDSLEGYRRSAPVRVGNDATGQLQLDSFGELVNLTWRWHRRGHSPSDDDWRFLVSLIDRAADRCTEPDCGLWEWPGEPEHFVHSKVMCWAALERGIRLADECMRRAPVRRWKQVRDELRETIESRGYDRKRGVFVQAYGRTEMDASLLLLPSVEFVGWNDERMLRTVAAIREELDAGDGLLYRYRRDDGLDGQEGAFLCCSFWLVECLARSEQLRDARAVFDHAIARSNDLGLFSEELDPSSGELLGNFPQGLTHLAHIDAAVALAECERAMEKATHS